MAPTLRSCKRNSSPGPAPVSPAPTTPRSAAGSINHYFETVLVPLVGDLPFTRQVSPEKRPRTPRHDLVRHVTFLFHQEKARLAAIVRQIQQRRYKRPLDRFEKLRHEASILFDALTTPRKTPVAPISAPDISMPPPIDIPMPPPIRQASNSSSTIIPRDKSFNVSFASTVAQSANTSFTTSFASTVQPPNTEPPTQVSTPATSPDSSPAGKLVFDETDLLPSSALDPEVLAEVERLERHDEAVQMPPSSSVMEIDPPLHDPPLPSPHSTNLHWRISEVPMRGIAPVDLPDMFYNLPFIERVEAYRVMKACNLSPNQLIAKVSQPVSLPDIYAVLSDPESNPSAFRKCSKDVDSTRLSLHATLRYIEDRRKPLFDLCLELPVKEDLTPFQRKYGPDRFLLVELPSLNRPPASCGRQIEQLHEKVLEMLTQTQPFLGRNWIHFHTHAKKHQLMFFAESGIDLEPISIAEVFEWFIPFQQNAGQSACKANARLDLGQSRSKATVIFEPRDIIYGHPDKMSSTHVPDFPFDSALDMERKICPEEVMDDGCSKISAAAMSQIKQILGLDYVPAVVQARIFGAKGVWYRDVDDKDPNNTTITINQSQIKVWHSTQTGASDPHLRTMNIVNYSRPARTSYLYPDFLPILVNQGVPAASILAIARRQVCFATQEYLDALSNPRLLHHWVHAQKDLIGPRLRDEEIWRVGDFPDCREERICQLLEAGFEPARCKKLAEEARFVGASAFELEARRFKIQLDKSTTLIGIADPSDSLGPGEIHVSFSSPFGSRTSDDKLSSLDNRFVLVARNPSMRNSDIQKVRAVYRPELAHLHDVAVFSTKGARPIASMLSGGDHDGDTFWICWDDKLVEPFRNALAPWERDRETLEYFRISKDTIQLKDLAPSHAQNWHHVAHRLIQRSAAARLKFQLLGPVTLTYGDLTYADGNITSDKAFKLVDLHDLLVDADKQGYRYTEDDWRAFKKDLSIPANLKEPAYRRFTRPKEARDVAQEPTASGSNKDEFKRDNIIDRLYFLEVKPTIDDAMAKAKGVGKGQPAEDADLSALHDQIQQSSAPDSPKRRELIALKEALFPIRAMWHTGMGVYKDSKLAADWNLAITECKSVYDGIVPTHVPDELKEEWTRPRGCEPTIWEEQKASTIATIWPNRANIIFHMAGEVLCRLKARAQPGSRTRVIREGMYLPLKPKHRRGMENALSDDDEDSDTEQDEFAATASTQAALELLIADGELFQPT